MKGNAGVCNEQVHKQQIINVLAYFVWSISFNNAKLVVQTTQEKFSYSLFKSSVSKVSGLTHL